MTDEDLKKIEDLLDKKIKPIHSEVARNTAELREVKIRSTELYLGTGSFKKDIARLESRMETVQDSLDDPEKGLTSLKDGQDALTADMYQVQKTTNATFEAFKHYKERHEDELDEIREHINLPLVERTPFEPIDS